jgi:hypothetical protein
MAITNNIKTKKCLSLRFCENQASTRGKSGTLRCSIVALGETCASHRGRDLRFVELRQSRSAQYHAVVRHARSRRARENCADLCRCRTLLDRAILRSKGCVRFRGARCHVRPLQLPVDVAVQGGELPVCGLRQGEGRPLSLSSVHGGHPGNQRIVPKRRCLDIPQRSRGWGSRLLEGREQGTRRDERAGGAFDKAIDHAAAFPLAVCRQVRPTHAHPHEMRRAQNTVGTRQQTCPHGGIVPTAKLRLIQSYAPRRRLFGLLNRPEAPAAKVPKCLADLGLRVHDERPATDDRFVDGCARQD